MDCHALQQQVKIGIHTHSTAFHRYVLAINMHFDCTSHGLLVEGATRLAVIEILFAQAAAELKQT